MQVSKSRRRIKCRHWGTEVSLLRSCTHVFNREKPSMFSAHTTITPWGFSAQNTSGIVFNTEYSAAALTAWRHQISSLHQRTELLPPASASSVFVCFLQCWKSFSYKVECPCAQDYNSQWQKPFPGKQMVWTPIQPWEQDREPGFLRAWPRFLITNVVFILFTFPFPFIKIKFLKGQYNFYF